MGVSESTVLGLPVPEQIFILVNEERIGRGLPPISYLTAQLNADAQEGANTELDPTLPSTVTGAGSLTWAGAIWAGGILNSFEADFYWMYSDGWSGLLGMTTNIACTLLNPSGCWGHRDIILSQFVSCGAKSPTLSMGAGWNASVGPGGSVAAVLVSTCGAVPSDVTMTWSQLQNTITSTSPVVGMATLSNSQGYWVTHANGEVDAFGQADNFGSMQGHVLGSPIVGMASTPDGLGYWLVAADGGIFSFGDAGFYGSTGALRLVAPIVGMTPTPSGGGYWMVAADGGIFAFGNAAFHGSMGNQRLNRPIVGMTTDTATGGYWLVASDGGIFSFGAPFLGSTGAIRLNKPIIGMASTSNGQGYRLFASDGGVFAFGQSPFDGSAAGQNLLTPVVGMAADLATGGYWLVAANGGIFGFGGALVLAGESIV